MDSQRRTLEKKLGALEDEVGVMVTAVAQLAVASAEDDNEDNHPRVMLDAIWACERCHSRLGIFSRDMDEVRIRHKGSVTYITPGVGGLVKQLCYKCGHINQITDNRQVE